MRTWRSAISSHLALAAFSSARTSWLSWSISFRRWAPTTSSSISQPRCWRSTPKCDSAFSSAPTRRMFSSQYSAASRAKRSARSSSTPDGGARAAGLLAEDVGEDRAEVDGGAGRLRDLGRRLAVAAVGFVRRPRGGDAEVDLAQRRVGDLQRRHQLAEQLLLDARRQAAQHGVHQVALLGARIAVGGAVEAGEAVDQATDLDFQLAAHLGALDRRIAHRDQALHQVGDAAVVGLEGLVPGARRIGEVALHVDVLDEMAAQLDGALRRRSRRCPARGRRRSPSAARRSPSDCAARRCCRTACRPSWPATRRGNC